MNSNQNKMGVRREPLFVVGFPRSGTTLLAAMLARHSQLSCGPETRFFHFLEKSDPDQLLVDWPENALDFLFSLLLMDIPVPDQFGLSRDEIRSYLNKHEPSIANILSSLCDQFMSREGKQRWMEKSPEHLPQVNKIRDYFPESPIIRIIRDPRDAALSMVKMPWATDDYMEAIMMWRGYDDKSVDFFQNDANSFSLHYEKLIEDPEISLRAVCDFLSENFEQQMLNTVSSASSVITALEPWKLMARDPVDKSRIYVWKHELTQDLRQQTEAVIGDRLSNYTYETTEQFKFVALAFPSVYKLFEYRDSFDQLVQSGARFWGEDQDGEMSKLIFVGEPNRDRWLSFSRPRRWLDALRIIGEILLSNLKRQEVIWIRSDQQPMGKGITSQIITRAFGITLDSQTS